MENAPQRSGTRAHFEGVLIMTDHASESAQSSAPSSRWTGLVRTVRPTLVVAVGGTGASAAKIARKRMTEILGPEAPRTHFVAFRALDTAAQDSREPRFVDHAEYIYLGGFNAQSVIADIVEGHAFPHWKRWLPPRLDFQQVAFGAGGIRPIGRLCYFYHRRLVETAIHEALATITDAEQALSFHQEHGVKVALEAGIDIHLICSVCGGTGSGMFLDLAFDLRQWAEQHTPQAITVTGHLVLPEAFRSKAVSFKALEANAYVALEELDRFMNASSADAWTVEHEQDQPSKSWRSPFDHCYLLSGLQQGATSDVDTLTSVIGEALTLLTFSQVGQKVSEGVINMAGQRKSTRDARGRLCCYSSYGVLGLEIPWDLLGQNLSPKLAERVRARFEGTNPVSDDEIETEVSNFLERFSFRTRYIENTVPETPFDQVSVAQTLSAYRKKLDHSLVRATISETAQAGRREIERLSSELSKNDIWISREIEQYLNARAADWLLDRPEGLKGYVQLVQEIIAALRRFGQELGRSAQEAGQRAQDTQDTAEAFERGDITVTGKTPEERLRKSRDKWQSHRKQKAREHIFQSQAIRLARLSDSLDRRLGNRWQNVLESFLKLRFPEAISERSFYRSRRALAAICPLRFFAGRLEAIQGDVVDIALQRLLTDITTWDGDRIGDLEERVFRECADAVRLRLGQEWRECDQLLTDHYSHSNTEYDDAVGAFLQRAAANWEVHQSYALRGNIMEIPAVGAESSTRFYQRLQESYKFTAVDEQRPEYLPIFRSEHGLSLIGIKRLEAYRQSFFDSIVQEQRYDLHFVLDRRWVTRMEFAADNEEDNHLLRLFSLAEMEGLIHRRHGSGYELKKDRTLLGDHRRAAFLHVKNNRKLRHQLKDELGHPLADEDGKTRTQSHIEMLRKRVDEALFGTASGNASVHSHYLSLDAFQIHSEIRALLAAISIEDKGI